MMTPQSAGFAEKSLAIDQFGAALRSREENGELLESGHFQMFSKVRQKLYVRLRTFTLKNFDLLLVLSVVVIVAALVWEVQH